MKIKDFVLWQWWVSNDWAIKLKKIGKKYEVYLVLEDGATAENVKFTDDPVINMNLEMFVQMFKNEWFIKFKELGGSTLKASDCNNYVLDNLASIEEMTKQEVIDFLSLMRLWSPRGIDKDLSLSTINEENKDRE